MGKAIVGELSGYELNIVPFDVISWKDWKELYPDTLVLTTDTGHVRSYGVDPYGDYYTNPRIMFPVENNDDRMHPKEIILGFFESDIHKAYKQQDVESKIIINDKIGDKSILLTSLYNENSRAFDRNVDGKILEFEYKNDKILDIQTQTEWNYDGIAISGMLKGSQLERIPFSPGFWFEWVAFHPDTEIYGEF